MANIKTFIKTNIEKGNKWLDVDGNILNKEKIEKLAKKSFMDGMKNNEVKDNVTLKQYTKDFTEKNFTVLEEVLALFEPHEEVSESESELPNN